MTQTSMGSCSGKTHLRGWDLLGVVLSGACLIHCTVLPAILALLPVLGSHFHLDDRWHFYITLLIVPVACIALVTGWWRHRKGLVMILGSTALAMILGAHPMEEIVGQQPAEVIAVLGGCLLISAHLFNHKCLHEHADREYERLHQEGLPIVGDASVQEQATEVARPGEPVPLKTESVECCEEAAEMSDNFCPLCGHAHSEDEAVA